MGEMMQQLTGKVINIQDFSLHDGPGIRTTIFFKGCPLHCIWCANPDTQTEGFQLYHSDVRCIGCQECEVACPEKAIRWKEFIEIARDGCTLCGECIEACSAAALRIDGYEVTLNTILEKIQSESLFYKNSGGGVTLSGGEPLSQPLFAEAVLKKCEKWGVHTAMETSGCAPYETLQRLSTLLDLIYFDVKHLDDSMHRQITGVSNNLILANLQKISKVHSGIVVRVPVIPTINSSEEDMDRLGDFLTEKTEVRRVEFLNYHRLGEQKYTSIGKSYTLTDLEPFTKEEFENHVRYFQTKFPTINVIYHA